MNVLDENFPDDQRRFLQSKRVRVRKVGRDLGRRGGQDDEIIPLLHQLDRPTFFTLDWDFYDRHLCHEGYCLVYLNVDKEQVAEYVRRLLRHSVFDSKAKRMGLVIQAQPTGLTVWRIHAKKEAHLDWE